MPGPRTRVGPIQLFGIKASLIPTTPISKKRRANGSVVILKER
jgi:hypothetical protein